MGSSLAPVAIGPTVRRFVGPKIFSLLGTGYRSIFADIDKMARCLSREIPPDAHVLDIGGGDGAPLDRLLCLRPDVSATMIDVGHSLGHFLSPARKDRVTLMPGTSMKRYLSMKYKNPDRILLSDVLHHVPPAERDAFLGDLKELETRTGALVLIKDLEPGYFISRLGVFCDRHITGDRNVALISRAELDGTLRRLWGDVVLRETSLFEEDCPNYLVSVEGRG